METVIYAVSILFAIIVVISGIIRNKRKCDLENKSKGRIRYLQPDGMCPEFYGIYLANKQGYSHKITNKKWTKKNY